MNIQFGECNNRHGRIFSPIPERTMEASAYDNRSFPPQYKYLRPETRKQPTGKRQCPIALGIAQWKRQL